MGSGCTLEVDQSIGSGCYWGFAMSARQRRYVRRGAAIGALTVGLALMTACGGGGGSSSTKSQTVESESGTSSATSADADKGKIDAKAMEATFREQLGGKPIKSMCDANYTHWACFYNGVKAEPGYLRIDLSTDADAPDPDEMAAKAGRAWFNFLACKYPDLTTIVVQINGIDHNVYRRDTAADKINC